MQARYRFTFLFLAFFVCLLVPLWADDQHGTMEPPLAGKAGQSSGAPYGRPFSSAAMLDDCAADPPTPVVTLKVRTEACATPSQDIVYRIKVENKSAAFAHHVLIRNPLPANARFVRASPEPHQVDQEIQWKLNTMAPGACCDILLVLAPTNNDDVRNCTRVVFEHGQCVTTRQVRAGPPGVEEKIEKEPRVVPPAAGPSKLKLDIDGPKDQFANRKAKYFITVKNIGGEAATNVLITATLPEQGEYVSSSDGGRFHAQQVAWIIGRVDAGASRTVEVVMQAKQAGKLCLKATSFWNSDKKETAEFCTLFAGQSALTMDTTNPKDPVAVDDQTSYLIRITNQGQVPLTNLRLQAKIPAEMQLVRAAGASDAPEQRPEAGKPLEFLPLKELAPGASASYEVFVKALRPGDVRFRVELRADQLDSGRPVIEEESTLLFAN